MKRLHPVLASPAILEKIEEKHGIDWEEVEDLFRRPHLVLRGPMDQYGERRYSSLGQGTDERYLLVVYTVPEPGLAKVITARDMNDHERAYYRRTHRPRRRP